MVIIRGFYYQKGEMVIRIKKIAHHIMEVYDANVYPGGRSVRQLRINCKSNEIAVGRIDIFGIESDISIQTFYHNKRGWKWFESRDEVAQKLINIVCKRDH
jgi:hypothetical protein